MNKILILLLLILGVQAKTFNVSTTPELREALENAAANGEDDTIILANGTYKTTDDNGGTFIYFDNEDYNLTLKGSNSANVILSGDNIERIFQHTTMGGKAPLKLEKLSFVDGNSSSVAGLYTDYSIDILDCNFSNNNAIEYGAGFYSYSHESTIRIINSIFSNNKVIKYGGGFYSTSKSIEIVNSTFNNNNASRGGGFYSSSESIKVTNSTFNDNSATDSGGGFYSTYESSSSHKYNASQSYSDCVLIHTVTNSTFTNNSATDSGGGFSSSKSKSSDLYDKSILRVINSTFNDNNASRGGGFISAFYKSTITVTGSIFNDNNASRGGGFYSYGNYSNDTVTNSIFTNNSATNSGGGFYSSSLKASNLLLSENNSGIFINTTLTNIIENSIFINNKTSDIDSNSNVVIKKLYNNYIDTSKLAVENVKKNNVFNGVNLGFVNKDNGDYHLTSSSNLIDVGTTSIIEFTLPTIDFDENTRVVGSNIDIGPYEFSSTKPTINNISFNGDSKAYSTLTFTTTSIPNDNKTITSIEYDFTDNGIFTTTNTISYSVAGIYTVKVKVTDNDGEYSISSKEITIAPLSFNEMSLEQKIASLTTDQTKIDSIISDINNEEIVSTALNIDNITNLPLGWSNIGIAIDITDLSIFNNIKIVWIYDNSTNSWSAYSSASETMSAIGKSTNINIITSILSGSAIWVLK